MKTLARAIGTLVILFGMLVNGSAMAQYRGYGHGHSHGPIVRFGFSYGFPIYPPGYFPAPYYTYPGYVVPAPAYVYPPAVVVHSSPPVYVERSITQAEPAAPQTQNDWYYCAGSQTYYPYAKDCPGGWQRVPAQPSPR
jgi:hypothetical protein